MLINIRMEASTAEIGKADRLSWPWPMTLQYQASIHSTATTFVYGSQFLAMSSTSKHSTRATTRVPFLTDSKLNTSPVSFTLMTQLKLEKNLDSSSNTSSAVLQSKISSEGSKK